MGKSRQELERRIARFERAIVRTNRSGRPGSRHSSDSRRSRSRVREGRSRREADSHRDRDRRRRRVRDHEGSVRSSRQASPRSLRLIEERTDGLATRDVPVVLTASVVQGRQTMRVSSESMGGTVRPADSVISHIAPCRIFLDVILPIFEVAHRIWQSFRV